MNEAYPMAAPAEPASNEWEQWDGFLYPAAGDSCWMRRREWDRFAAYFRPYEFACPHSGKVMMERAFMNALYDMRHIADTPFVITSGYRTVEYNTELGGAAHSAHCHGRAADVHVRTDSAYGVLALAITHGMNGIGIKQRGRMSGRYFHFDNIKRGEIPNAGGVPMPRPRVWTYA